MNRNDFSAADAFAITPSDTAPIYASGLYVGGAGNLTVVTEAGTEVAFAAVPVGTVIPVRVVRVMATGTTATNVVGFR